MIKKTMTAKVLAANRSNGSRSKGPKSEKGKSLSRRNALKHGILARTLLTADGDQEDAAEYRKMLEAMHPDIARGGPLAEFWIATILTCWLRQKRALHCELKLAPEAFDDSYTAWGNQSEAEAEEHHRSLVGAQFDRLLRYQKAIEQELFYALAQLDRLQRTRLGKEVSMPAKLQLTSTR